MTRKRNVSSAAKAKAGQNGIGELNRPLSTKEKKSISRSVDLWKAAYLQKRKIDPSKALIDILRSFFRRIENQDLEVTLLRNEYPDSPILEMNDAVQWFMSHGDRLVVRELALLDSKLGD